MYIHVCTCLCFSIIVYTMSVSRCTLALSEHGTYMVQTCLYTFMPGGQDSRCVSEQRGVETGTQRGTKDGSTRKRCSEVEVDTKQFLGIK